MAMKKIREIKKHLLMIIDIIFGKEIETIIVPADRKVKEGDMFAVKKNGKIIFYRQSEEEEIKLNGEDCLLDLSLLSDDDRRISGPRILKSLAETAIASIADFFPGDIFIEPINDLKKGWENAVIITVKR